MTLIPFAEDLEYSAIAECVRSNVSVTEAHATIIDTFIAWWDAEGREQIRHLRSEGAILYSTAEEMKSAFVVALGENGILDHFALRGAFVEWFNLNESTLRTIVETGYPAALIDDESVLSLEHKNLLDQYNQLIIQTGEINAQYDLLRSLNRGNNTLGDDEAEESVEQIGDFIPNSILEPLEVEKKDCTDRINILLSECKEIHQQLFDRDEVKTLSNEVKPPKGKTTPTGNNLHKLDDLVTAIEGIATLNEMRNSLVVKIAEWDLLHTRKNEIIEIMKPHEDYKLRRKVLNDSLVELKEQLFVVANEVRKTLPEEFVISEVTNHLCSSLGFQLQRRLDANVDELIRLVQSMHRRYASTQTEVRAEVEIRFNEAQQVFHNGGYLDSDSEYSNSNESSDGYWFPLSEGWVERPLGELFETQLGKMKGKTASIGEQFPFLKNRNLHWGQLKLDDLETMHFTDAERIMYALEPGDLLITEGGEVGRCAIWRGEVLDCYIQNSIHRVRAIGEVPVEYLRYFMEYATKMPRFERFVQQTSIAHLSQGNLRSIPIPYHPDSISVTISNLNTLSQLVESEVESLNKTSSIYTGLLQSEFSNWS